MDNDNFRYILDAVNAKHERTEKRLFIIIISLIVAIVLYTGIFIWYISLPVEEVASSISQEANDTESTQLIGGDYYGQTDENNDLQTESK